jgi:hypothetical protein
MRRARPDFDVPEDAVLQIDKSAGKAPYTAIFQEGRAFSTVMFWIVYFTNVYVIFGFTISSRHVGEALWVGCTLSV